MKSNDMINLIIDVEKNQHGITQLYPSRIHYFQRTKRYASASHCCRHSNMHTPLCSR